MKKLMKKIENIMVAITFAEAGEYDEANRHSGNSMTADADAGSVRLDKPVLENAAK